MYNLGFTEVGGRLVVRTVQGTTHGGGALQSTAHRGIVDLCHFLSGSYWLGNGKLDTGELLTLRRSPLRGLRKNFFWRTISAQERGHLDIRYWCLTCICLAPFTDGEILPLHSIVECEGY